MSTAVTTATFESEVLQSEKPVIVDFWAEWCGPCHAVSPVLEKIAEERKLKLVKVNIDENQNLAMRYGIQSIPNMILFENGQPKANVIGAMPKACSSGSSGSRSKSAARRAASALRVTLEKREEGCVLREELLDLGDPRPGPVLEPRLGEVVLDPVEAPFAHAGMIGSAPDIRHGPIGSTWGLWGPSGTMLGCLALRRPRMS